MKARRFLGVYLKKEDIPDSGLLARIRGAKEDTLEEDDGSQQSKMILFFHGLEKGLVMNATNINVLIDMTGTEETDDWIDREIEIYVDHGVMLRGKRVGGVRLRAPGPQLKSGLEPTPVDPQPPRT